MPDKLDPPMGITGVIKVVAVLGIAWGLIFYLIVESVFKN